MTDDFATIRAGVSDLRQMMELSAAGYHDDVYLRVTNGEVHFVTQTNGRQVMSFCTFTGDYFSEVDGEAEAIIPSGINNDTKGYLDYLNLADEDGTVEMTLLGDEPDDPDGLVHPYLAKYWRAEGALNVQMRLPGDSTALQRVPFSLPNRFVDDEHYLSRSCMVEDDDGLLYPPDDKDEYVTPPTIIETTTAAIRQSIIEPADFMEDLNYYPLVVEDGQLRVDIGRERGDDAVWGDISADAVTGPDITKSFDDGFPEVFKTLSGPVRLSTAPEPDDPPPSPPLVVVQQRSDYTLRHVVGTFTEA